MIKKYELSGETCFYLANECMSAVIRIHCSQPELLHLGAVLAPEDAEALSYPVGTGWGGSLLYAEGDNASCLDVLPLAWSESGKSDLRESPILLSDEAGTPLTADFRYSSFLITPGIVPMHSGLPQAEGECETLELNFCAASERLSKNTKLKLIYSVFDTAITARAVLFNGGTETLGISKMMSMMADLPGEYNFTTLDGQWIAEAHAHTVPVSYSRVVNESVSGFSSNRHNPGFIVSHADCTADSGTAYGFNLVYSGNHYASAQLSPQGFTRIMQGISPDSFSYKLAPDESFESPEEVICFSEKGFNGLRNGMHSFINSHIVPEQWRYRQRPVLYNSWEGCMFTFHEKTILSLASKAKKLGCELFVLDDGWFGERNDDTAGLGDYTVNTEKLPGGLKGLAEKIRSMGMDFGLWFEPEAVNPNSELYRKHPDWAIHRPGLDDIFGRNELLLDLRKKEVRDYIVSSVSSVLDSVPISYVKWDMNRNSTLTGAEAHSYILGLYEVLHRLFDSRKNILLEMCASGGNRFDLGMLRFAPQIWVSDDTDPIERLDIQGGLSLLYPQSVMGAHVSASPHSQTLRTTPLSTRINTAFFGSFGIELELGNLLPVELSELKDSISFYKEHRSAFQFGNFREEKAEKEAVCWSVANDEECIAGLFHRLVKAAPGWDFLCVSALEKEERYCVSSRSQNLRVGRFGELLKHVAPVKVNPNGALVRTADRHYKMQDGRQSFECSGAALRKGIPLSQRFSGAGYDANMRNQGDFQSNIYIIKRKP